jgi:Fibronectin type III domain
MSPALTLPACSRRREVLLRKFFRPNLFLAALLACACALGCAAPGVPTPPQPIVPKPVTDLTAHQAGNSILLSFTLPKQSTENNTLEEKPAIEIFQGERLPGGPAKLTTHLKYTIPSAFVDTYLQDGVITFADQFESSSLKGQEEVYMVRTRASKRRASADSNVVSLRAFPVPAAPAGIQTNVTQSAIELSWTAPPQPAAGAITGYRVYRADVAPGAAVPQNLTGVSQIKPPATLELIGPAPTTSFRDTDFTFGATYVYSVRSVAEQQGQSVESGDSALVVITPKDIFPPATPQGLVALSVPATPESPAHIELSWEISTEPDLAGYWVYRSEESGTPAQRLNSQLLLTPTFRDMTAVPGKRYTYQVTAVDRSGNESTPSVSVTAQISQ